MARLIISEWTVSVENETRFVDTSYNNDWNHSNIDNLFFFHPCVFKRPLFLVSKSYVIVKLVQIHVISYLLLIKLCL